MGVVNRRNAVIGWAVLQIVKQYARRQARRAVPEEAPSRKLGAMGLLAALLAVGAFVVWRLKSAAGGADEQPL
jgi:hypothetical protein